MSRIEVLGLPVDVLEQSGLLSAVEDLVEAGAGGRIAYLNVHVANTAASNPALAAILHSTDVVYCDGEGIRLAARWLGQELPERMTGADWIWDLAALAEKKAWRLFWLGGRPGVAAAASEALKQQHPTLQMETDHGFHSEEEQEALLTRIQAYAPHIVLVGLGTPLQEQWMDRTHSLLSPAVTWCLGATADFVSGEVSRGPAWLHTRQEWISRLVTEPRRLWKRYLVGNTRFALRLVLARRSQQ